MHRRPKPRPKPYRSDTADEAFASVVRAADAEADEILEQDLVIRLLLGRTS